MNRCQGGILFPAWGSGQGVLAASSKRLDIDYATARIPTGYRRLLNVNYTQCVRQVRRGPTLLDTDVGNEISGDFWYMYAINRSWMDEASRYEGDLCTRSKSSEVVCV